MSFTITDKPIVDLTNIMFDTCKNEGIEAAIVGGFGSQINIAHSIHILDSRLDIHKLAKKSTPYFRPTEDIDLATLYSITSDGRKDDFRQVILRISDMGYEVSFKAEKNKENKFTGHAIIPELSQNNRVRLNFNIGEATGIDKEYYASIMSRATNVDIPYFGKTRLKCKVIDINDLIVNKIVGNVREPEKRSKDYQDALYNYSFGSLARRLDRPYMTQIIDKYYSDPNVVTAFENITAQAKIVQKKIYEMVLDNGQKTLAVEH